MVNQSPLLPKSLAAPNSPGGKGCGSTIRVLVVDDNEPFRRFVGATLSRWPELQIVGEAVDGLEAVQRAVELQPALIVLDIGLPGLNGLEAARRIRQLAPKATILFLSQESSPDIVREALDLGAGGFVFKAHAATDLLIAVESVLRNEKFVSRTRKSVDGQD